MYLKVWGTEVKIRNIFILQLNWIRRGVMNGSRIVVLWIVIPIMVLALSIIFFIVLSMIFGFRLK